MGFFDWFSGKPGRFLSESAHRKNLAFHAQMAPATLQVLRQHGVTSGSRVRLEFHFATNSEEKAQALSVALKRAGYDRLEDYPDQADRRRRIVNGWTQPMLMSKEVVVAWTRRLCEAGQAHDCSFEGWGTDGSG